MMMFVGFEVSGSHPFTGVQGSGSMAVHLNSVDIVKGWTRATSVVWIMLAVSELDPSEESTKAFVKPSEKVLDRAWLLPMHVSQLNKGHHAKTLG